MFVIPLNMLQQTGPYSYEIGQTAIGLQPDEYPIEIFVDGLSWTSTMLRMEASAGRAGWWYFQNGTTVKVEIFNDR